LDTLDLIKEDIAILWGIGLVIVVAIGSATFDTVKKINHKIDRVIEKIERNK
jgi:hypothetical protein